MHLQSYHEVSYQLKFYSLENALCTNVMKFESLASRISSKANKQDRERKHLD
jgi:hypothetical protein